ncbi:hypothetical protein C1H46_018456 [Malus baccata]|uniref:Uncharacterized protein n=1 Tax=Malus baccata TaxID=106549 RepID=A0A540MBW0_MALBA|nr:hypothetical protein C1H46_018456 [Malus baccata]
MAMKKKASEAVEEEQMMKLKLKNPSQQEQMVELHNKAEPWIFKPKAGSVFPVKKRAASEFIYEKLKKINKQETTQYSCTTENRRHKFNLQTTKWLISESKIAAKFQMSALLNYFNGPK